MKNLEESYRELLAWAQLYMLQNYSPEDKLFAADLDYQYFKKWALKQSPSVGKEPFKLSPLSEAGQPPLLHPLRAPLPHLPIQEKLQPGPFPLSSSQKAYPQDKKGLEPDKKEVLTSAPAELVQEKAVFFVLEKPAKPTERDFSRMRKTVESQLLDLQLLDTIPDDSEAKSISSKEKECDSRLLILVFDESPKQQLFLSNICKALEMHQVASTTLNAHQIEKRNGWDAILSSKKLQLLMACNYQIKQAPELMKHYREESKHANYYFSNTPALLLPDLSIYFKEPSLKASLWQAIQTHLHLKR